MVMDRWGLLVALHLCLGVVAVPSALRADDTAKAPKPEPQLTVLKMIPVGGSGRWDYLYADAAARRLYVPRSTHTQIVDLDKGTVLGDLPDTKGVHGVALALEQGLGFTSNGGANAVSVFDLKTFKVCKTIKAGQKPDPIIYDPASKHILAMNHAGGDVTVIDPAALDNEPVTITVGGKLEFAVADGAGHVYVNVEDKDETVAIDSKENKVLAHWPLAPGKAPTGLAMDVEHHRLFVGCGNQKMVMLDSESGKVLGQRGCWKGRRRRGLRCQAWRGDDRQRQRRDAERGQGLRRWDRDGANGQDLQGRQDDHHGRQKAPGSFALQHPRRQGGRNVRNRCRRREEDQENRVCSIITEDYAAGFLRARCSAWVVRSRCAARSSRSMSKAIREEMCDLVRTRYTVFCILR